MTCNPKMNYILFSAMESKGGGVHSSVVRRGSGSSGWAVLFLTNDFNTPGVNEQFHSHFKITKSLCERIVKLKQWYSINI